MKELLALGILISSLIMSCKKEPDPQQLVFLPTIASPDVIKWDSIAYTTINYSDMNELKPEEIENRELYHHSLNMDIQTGYLTLDANHTFVLKKFDMIAKSGKVMYYVPFSGEPSALDISFKLPFLFNTTEGRSNISFSVIRYKEITK